MTLEDADMIQAPDSVQRATARNIARYILEPAHVDPPLAVVVVGWKTPGFAGPALEKKFRFPADSLRAMKDST